MYSSFLQKKMVYLEKFDLLVEDEEWCEFVRPGECCHIFHKCKRLNVQKGRFYNHTNDECYPYQLFPQKQFEVVDFDDITIFYGGNGSGKTTLLNIIADKLGLYRITPCPQSIGFQYYLEICRYSTNKSISVRSKFLTSDDVFNHILSVREENIEIASLKSNAREYATQVKNGIHSVRHINFENSKEAEEATEKLDLFCQARQLTVRQFIKRRVGELQRQYSNGENALMFFDKQIEEDALYLLDEPENSLSPQFQLEFKTLIEDSVRYKNCQFIIATHSPFMLALKDAKIYNLDTIPVTVNKWHQLENMRIYYEFFKKYEDSFNY